MSGFHCKYCGKLNIPSIDAYCNCEEQKLDNEAKRLLLSSIIMRDPIKRDGYTENRSNELDENEMWSAIDNGI